MFIVFALNFLIHYKKQLLLPLKKSLLLLKLKS
jgi:hypothetical protein